MPMADCLIIGAGLSGVTAAQQLSRKGYKVVLLDKSRGVGGRLSTRRTDAGRFDHGAQFFTVRDPLFAEQTQKWIEQGVVQQWSQGFFDGVSESHDGHPRYIGIQGMNTLVKSMSHELEIHVNEKATSISATASGWEVHTESNHVFHAKALLMTPPVPQSLDLVSSYLSEEEQSVLSQIQYAPCIAGLFEYEESFDLPSPGAIQLQTEPVLWIANNAQKGLSSKGALVTIHMAPQFSDKNWDMDHDTLTQVIVDAIAPWVSGTLSSAQIHRWRYGQPLECYEHPHFVANSEQPLAFAGDAFRHSRVEGAFLSGLSAADALHHAMEHSQ